MAAHVLGITRGELESALITGRAHDFDSDRFDALISERAQRVPLQHLTGLAPFRDLELSVGPGVFVPRPETESVAQVAIDAIEAARASATGRDPVIAVDLCTGSGAIALALATESEADAVHAVELSELAFAWAEQNARKIASDRPLEHLHLYMGDATAPEVLEELNGRVDVVVSNPPYIPPDSVPVDIEVREHDPEIALYGRGADGLKVPGDVLNRAQSLLKPGGVIIMEHAEVQAASLREMATERGWKRVETINDLTKRPRMLYATCASTRDMMGE